MKLLKIAALCWGAVIFFFSVVNPPVIGPTTPSDLVLHFAAYAFLAALTLNSMPKNTRTIAISVMIYGIVLEIVQHFIGRTFSFIDISVNCIGVLTAAAIYYAINKQNSKS
jgi:VanZ family protein